MNNCGLEPMRRNAFKKDDILETRDKSLDNESTFRGIKGFSEQIYRRIENERQNKSVGIDDAYGPGE